MNPLTLPAIVLVLAGVPATAAAKNVVDPIQLKYDTAYQKELNKHSASCKKKFKTVGDRQNCWDAAFEKARDKYPRRGTDDYAERTYRNLSPTEAEGVLTKLHQQFEVGSPSSAARLKPGVIARKDLVQEAVWIHEHVLKTPVTPQLQAVPWVVPCKQMTGLQKRVADRYIAMCPLADAEGTSMDRSR